MTFLLFERVASLIGRKSLELSRRTSYFGPFYVSSRLLRIASMLVAIMPIYLSFWTYLIYICLLLLLFLLPLALFGEIKTSSFQHLLPPESSMSFHLALTAKAIPTFNILAVSSLRCPELPVFLARVAQNTAGRFSDWSRSGRGEAGTQSLWSSTQHRPL